MTLRIGLIGDRDSRVLAHAAIPRALALAAEQHQASIDVKWIPTDAIERAEHVGGFDALWCVPGSPYRSMEGALLAIRAARETGRPFLGTCGGFQHAVLEYARSVLGWADAEHAESAPGASRQLVTPLACSLVEEQGRVRFTAASRLAGAYGALEAEEGYHCRFGLNPAFVHDLTAGGMRITAVDDAGDVRAVELDTHPFFVATLFQPERAALRGKVPPVVAAFVHAAREVSRKVLETSG